MTLTLLRHQQALAAPPGAPDHVLTALGHTSSTPIVRADLDAILNNWVAGTGGTIRTFTSQATFNTAIAAALPGDLIRATSSFTVTSGALVARGSLYNISGVTMTASPAGGTAALPIIITCADGVEITGSGLTNNVGAIDVLNVRHVWCIGNNITGTTQFGIRYLNGQGATGAFGYVAYNDINGCRDATIATQGWFQLIATSGGTPPSGDGNEWGFADFLVIEENDCIDPNPASVAGNPGEGIYLGRGGAPGWVSYARNIHVRGNRVREFKANGIEVKPGCQKCYVYDNDIVMGRGQNGAPIELCYQALSATSSRPAWMPADPEIWCEANRIWDFNITLTGASRSQCIILGMAGCRVANNLVWSVRDTNGTTFATIAGVLIQTELTRADFGDATVVPTWVVNNLFWCDGIADLGASDGPVSVGIIFRNNIVPEGYSGGQFEATTADFVGPVPVPGTLDDADQPGGDPGTGWELAATSALHGQGTSIDDLDLLIPFDPSGRTIPASGLNPGPFQAAAAQVVGGPGEPSRFQVYTDAALPGPNQRLVITTAVDLVDPLGALKATTDATRATGGVPLWAVEGVDLQLDPDRVLSRTVTVTVSSSEIDLVPDVPGDLLHPETGNRVRISAGLEGGPSMTLATLLVEAYEVDVIAGELSSITLELVDPGRPLRSNLVDPVPWTKGEPVEDVVARLLDIVLTEDPDLAETGYTMPAAGVFAPGRPVVDLVQQLLGGCGHELTADENGRIFSQPIPPTKADSSERWLYGGPGRLPVMRCRRRGSIRSPQGVLVKTGSLLSKSATFDVPVWDLDPASQGHYSGPGEVQVDPVTYDHLGSAQQAVAAGYGRLRRIGVGPRVLVIEIAPNPFMRTGDQVDLDQGSARSTGLYRVQSIPDMPTVPDSNQVVVLRAVWDPELGYTSPADPGIVCTVSAEDPFDRPDENLENKLQSPGSPLWTEHAYSWAVVGQVAIQRHNGTASLARYNVPLCGLDYVVGTEIAFVPAGKWIGPAARSSGQFDCYAAVVDSTGRIRLELWQASRKIAQLAEYVTNSDPAGKQLDLACDGSDIVVVWEGLEVIGKTDTRKSGVWAGMHALGGVQGQTAPGINRFTVQLL